MVGFAAAVSAVVAAGTLSAMFVDHLAERAVMRAAAEAPAAAREAAVKSAADRAANALAEVKPAAPAKRDAGKVGAAPAGLVAAAAPQSAAASAALKPATSAPEFPGEEEMPPAAPTNAYAEQNDADRKFDASAKEAGDTTDGTAAIATVPLPASAPFPEPRDKEAVEAEEAAGREARVTKYVNLRSGPTDESKVVAVVPAKASVSVIDCKAWCEVVFDGKKGWIYKRFIRES
ncbi:SH3 domain-containing protein [Mesorhizobium sp. AaZ16]|uniref:SH3 domain-containing protein n=1 Tax=Mesorhizobium sp. AaZ16 TaxID=3402289 RepID=UPI00374F1804